MSTVQLLKVEEVTLEVTVNSRRRVLLNKSSFEIDSGEISGIVGPSGSGKSTLLKSIIRMHSFTQGRILFKNIPLNKFSYPELRQQIAYLPQNPIFFEGTIKENLLHPFEFRQNRGLSKPDEKALKRQLELYGLEHQLDFNVHELSGGESQRLALVRISLLTPSILLLDEPTSGLDPDNTNIVIDQILDWQKESKVAILWIMHDRTVLKKLKCDVLNIENHSLVRYQFKTFQELGAVK